MRIVDEPRRSRLADEHLFEALGPLDEPILVRGGVPHRSHARWEVEFGEAHWVPIRYLYRGYSRNHLSQLYRAARVGYVTPLRDGMNLVAKEDVAAQEAADPGVLVLSQFAGAAAEMKDAILTNPYYADGMARDLDRALRMPLAERMARHERLLAAVERTTAQSWATAILDALAKCRGSQPVTS
jgi:trehalose 6-phosphate synthase